MVDTDLGASASAGSSVGHGPWPFPIRREVHGDPSLASVVSHGDEAPPPESSAPLTAELIERIIEAVEQRVIDELERRGLRHRPEVF